MPGLKVRPLGLVARIADILIIPIMYVATRSFESPQRTHVWNNMHLNRKLVENLDPGLMLEYDGIPCSSLFEKLRRKFPSLYGVFMHIRGIGPSDYVVIEPAQSRNNNIKWHIGWLNESAFGVSQITLRGRVRVLIGPDKVKFFGIEAGTCRQLELSRRGKGKIGNGSQHGKLPLL